MKTQNKYNDVYQEIIDELGLETTLKIYEMFKGLQINFPVRLYNSDYIKGCIMEEYNGSNLKALSRKYDYSQRWIRKILKDGST